jgi:hypothetical protein
MTFKKLLAILGFAKMSKADAKYTDQSSGKDDCLLCMEFKIHRCRVVKGRINPNGWCSRFAAKDWVGTSHFE